MKRAMAQVAGAIDGCRTAAELAVALSPGVPAATSLQVLARLEAWGLVQPGALEDRAPVAWAEGRDEGFLVALFALLQDRLEAVIEVPVPAGSPVHLFAGFAARQASEPARSGEAAAPGAAAPRKEVFGGRGFTRRQAVVSCLAEGAEAIATRYHGDEAIVTAPYREVAGGALHPEALLHFSARQYDERAARNRAQGGHNWIPPRFDEDLPVGWVEARAVTGGPARLVPAAYCFHGYREGPGVADFCAANSNGCASAASLDEAVVRGFAELAERDAAALWWYSRARRPAIDLESVPREEVQALRRWLAERGRQVQVLDLTTDLEVPVVAAVSSDVEGKRVIFGFGAHLDPGAALLGALTEMQQIAASAAMIAEHYGATRDPATDASALALLEWVQTATLESVPYLAPAEQPAVSYESWRRRFREPSGPGPSPGPGLGAGLGQVREVCERRGIACYAIDLTRADSGIPTARVVAPALRHFWARFGPGRLYEVPERLGWVPARLREAALNPTPLFL